LGAVVSSARTADAIPAFARRYALPCHFCHDGFPKLSVLGEQFKERGFRLENDATDAGEWWKSIPVSVRSSLRQTFEEEGDATTAGNFDLVSAGNLGNRASYWIDDRYRVDSDGWSRSGIGNAFLRVELLPEELYLRAGRIEMDLPFTQTRTPQLFAYEVYFANPGFETDNIGTHQDGVEAGGFLDDATRWSLALVSGQNSEEQLSISEATGGFQANVFGRLMRRFGEGRAGFYLYWGGNDLARENPDGNVLEWESNLFRLGFDGSIYAGEAHLYGTFLFGRNGNPYADAENPDGTEETVTLTGGFGQVDYAVTDRLFLSARLDWVNGPPPGPPAPSQSFVSFSPGLKLWLHSRIRLALELNFRNGDRPTRGAFVVDLVI
jgi:hypothetical protein